MRRGEIVNRRANPVEIEVGHYVFSTAFFASSNEKLAKGPAISTRYAANTNASSGVKGRSGGLSKTRFRPFEATQNLLVVSISGFIWAAYSRASLAQTCASNAPLVGSPWRVHP